jgi:outer membrane scaffolding protein for murein synthesis (MipA/OmpV family)
MEGLDLGVGVIYYTFPGTGGASTAEAYGSVALSMVPYVTPSITAYYDFDEVEGWYVTAGLDSEFALTEKMTLGLGASLGYGDSDYNCAYWSVNDSGLNDLNFSASLGYQVNDMFSVGVSAGYMVLVGSDVKDQAEADGKDTSQFYMGVSASFAF